MEDIGVSAEARVDDQREIYDDIRASFQPLIFEDRIVDFDRADNHKLFVQMLLKGLKRPRQFQPTGTILFTDRAQTGLYTNLQGIRARFNMHQSLKPFWRCPSSATRAAELRATVPTRPPV